MAIKYLSNINLDNNEIKNFIVDNVAANPSGLAGEGQLIYRTDTNELYYHTGSNTWVAISSGMVTWILAGDSGTQTIGDGQSATVAGESGFITTTAGATRQVTITMDDNAPSASAGTVAYPTSIGYNKKGQITSVAAGTEPITAFSISDGTTTESVANGNTITFAHNTGLEATVTATDTVTYSLQLEDLPDMTQSWVNTDEFIVLDGTAQKRKASNEIPINLLGLPDAALAMNSKKITGLLDPTAAQDAATKNYVDAATVGLLEFKGGFNATTGVIDGGTDNLTSGGSRVAISVGDFYVVTTAGDFYGDASEPLAVGDQVICKSDAAAGASVIGDWVTVQANIDVATATTVGLASFPTTGGTTITAAGAVSLDTQTSNGTYGGVTKSLSATVDTHGIVTGMSEQTIAIPHTQVTDFCTAVQTCVGTNLNYAATIGDNSNTTIAVSHNLGTQDVIVQLYDTTTFDTIYCDTVRTDANTVTITTTTALATNAARILISVS